MGCLSKLVEGIAKNSPMQQRFRKQSCQGDDQMHQWSRAAVSKYHTRGDRMALVQGTPWLPVKWKAVACAHTLCILMREEGSFRCRKLFIRSGSCRVHTRHTSPASPSATIRRPHAACPWRPAGILRCIRRRHDIGRHDVLVVLCPGHVVQDNNLRRLRGRAKGDSERL